ncbi:MAG: hypothetical protein G5701_06255 [Serratia symbiotica]|nr:hypothetical protein [Serratia symbiotica]
MALAKFACRAISGDAMAGVEYAGGACHRSVGYGKTKGNSARVSPHSGGNLCSKLHSGNGSWHKY